MDDMLTYYSVSLVYDDPITDVQRVILRVLTEKTGIQIDIANLTYGSAAETILALHNL